MRQTFPITCPLQVGDLVFILMGTPLFKKVATDTGSWTNHVGIIINVDGKEPMVAESKFPFSTITPLSRFVARSVSGMVEIRRLHQPLTQPEQAKLQQAVKRRLGILYDAGFNLHSRRQFCSRFVFEVVREATGREIGTVETFTTLFERNPQATLMFWRFWYLGFIPWHRETVTPASLLNHAESYTVLQGKDGNYSTPHLPEASASVTTNAIQG